MTKKSMLAESTGLFPQPWDCRYTFRVSAEYRKDTGPVSFKGQRVYTLRPGGKCALYSTEYATKATPEFVYKDAAHFVREFIKEGVLLSAYSVRNGPNDELGSKSSNSSRRTRDPYTPEELEALLACSDVRLIRERYSVALEFSKRAANKVPAKKKPAKKTMLG